MFMIAKTPPSHYHLSKEEIKKARLNLGVDKTSTAAADRCSLIPLTAFRHPRIVLMNSRHT